MAALRASVGLEDLLDQVAMVAGDFLTDALAIDIFADPVPLEGADALGPGAPRSRFPTWRRTGGWRVGHAHLVVGCRGG